MELLAAVVSSSVSCICMDISTSVADRCIYMKNPRGKFDTLITKRRDLFAQKEDVVMKLRAAEELQGREPTNEIKNWLQKAEDLIRYIDGLQEKVELERKYLYGVFPNCRSRLKLGKQITKLIKEVLEISKKGAQFSDGSISFLGPDVGMKLPTRRIVGKSTAEKNLEMVWRYLMDDEVGKVAVYGMGGIGKTTILREVNNRLLEQEHGFDKVIWVTVSKDASVGKLQDDIARELDLNFFDEHNEVRRSALLLRRLQLRKQFVLILDDMWKAFSLHEIGVPEPAKGNGCKLVLSTRSSEVCQMMECQVSVEIELLSKDEAWELFMDKIGKPLTPEIAEIADVMVKECCRLPLAIITTGGAMRGKDDVQEWRVALNDLRDSTNWVMNTDDRIFKCLKLSYDYLGNDILKMCFISCAMFPVDWNIRKGELIDYWIMDGLIEGKNMQDKLDRGHIVLNKLLYCCMLEKSQGQDYYHEKPHECVKMHCLLRDMAIRIATNKKFLIKGGLRLRKLPDVGEWPEWVEKASFMLNHIEDVPISPKCCRLTTLLLQGNPLRTIENDFFMHMQVLKILDLSKTEIELLPTSVSDLVNLNALVLNQCQKLMEVPSLVKLQSLEVLNLNGTAIIELPQGMEALVNLKCLDLRHTKLRNIPAGLISCLSSLQELQLYYVDEIYVPGGESGIAFVEELLRLTHLENISISFRCLSEFTRYVGSDKFKGLKNFAFDVVTISINKCFQPVKNNSVFISNEFNSIPDSMLWLPQNTLYLYISSFNDLQRLSKLVCLKDVKKLTECQIGCCSQMEHILSSEDDENKERSTLLQRLEVIRIHDCPKLSSIYKGMVTCGTLPLLKELCIWRCSNVKYLLSPMLFKQLTHLMDVTVQCCDELEEVIASEEEKVGESSTDISTSGSAHGNLRVLMLRKLDLFSLPKLRTAFSRLLQHFTNLEEVYVTYCEQMEELITEEGRKNETICPSNISLISCTITLPKLRVLKLKGLPKLQSIWKGVMVCDSLQTVELFECDELKVLPRFTGNYQSPPPSLKTIKGRREWWDSLEWGDPYAKNLLQPFFDPC